MNLETEMPINPIFIFIDGSYFCFYRYHSLLTWWKNAYPDQTDVLLDPYSNEKFVDKFKKTFGYFFNIINKCFFIKSQIISSFKNEQYATMTFKFINSLIQNNILCRT